MRICRSRDYWRGRIRCLLDLINASRFFIAPRTRIQGKSMKVPTSRQLFHWSCALLAVIMCLSCSCFFSPGWATGWGDIRPDSVLSFVAAVMLFLALGALTGMLAAFFLFVHYRYAFGRISRVLW